MALANKVARMPSRCDSALIWTMKGLVRRHLNEIKRRAIEGAITANANWHPARPNDELDVLDALGHGLGYCRGRKR